MITMVDNRTNYVRDISDLILDTYGNQLKIFPQSIPFSVRAAEISAEEISIFEHLHSSSFWVIKLRLKDGLNLKSTVKSTLEMLSGNIRGGELKDEE